jgi:hypothetical protein
VPLPELVALLELALELLPVLAPPLVEVLPVEPAPLLEVPARPVLPLAPLPVAGVFPELAAPPSSRRAPDSVLGDPHAGAAIPIPSATAQARPTHAFEEWPLSLTQRSTPATRGCRGVRPEVTDGP